jgi:hypothetical protein
MPLCWSVKWSNADLRQAPLNRHLAGAATGSSMCNGVRATATHGLPILVPPQAHPHAMRWLKCQGLKACFYRTAPVNWPAAQAAQPPFSGRTGFHAIHHRSSRMTEPTEEKSELEKARDIVSQLKEMNHYARSNMEKLSALWLLHEDGLKQKDRAATLDELLKHQGAFNDALEVFITDYEVECNRIENEAP